MVSSGNNQTEVAGGGRLGPEKKIGSGGIRTHASEETGALNQRLRPLGHTTCYGGEAVKTRRWKAAKNGL